MNGSHCWAKRDSFQGRAQQVWLKTDMLMYVFLFVWFWVRMFWLIIERSSFSMAAVACGGWMEVISGPKKITLKVQKVQQVWLKTTITLLYVFVCLFDWFWILMHLAGYWKELIFYSSRCTWQMDGSHFRAKKDSFQGSKRTTGLNSYC